MFGSVWISFGIVWTLFGFDWNTFGIVWMSLDENRIPAADSPLLTFTLYFCRLPFAFCLFYRVHLCGFVVKSLLLKYLSKN
jgi:hypothetical protein